MASTWAQAMADPAVPVHWLLELLGPGAPVRYADADLDVDGRLFAGALEMRTKAGVYVDPYSATFTSPNAVVGIAPIATDAAGSAPLRPYDLEETLRLPFIGWSCRLYIWAEGTPWTGTGVGDGEQLLLDGYVHEPQIEEDGTLVLTIVDRVLRHNVKLPRLWVTSDRWPNAPDEDRGYGYNILYGAFARIPAPILDDTGPTYDYAAIADGTVSAIAQGYYDDVALASEALSVAADGKGDTVSRMRVTIATDGAIGDKRATVSGTGYVDDALGTYTGTAGATITHPADQLRHLLINFCGVKEADLDTGSFIQMRNDLPGWNTCVQITGEYSSSLFAVLTDICSLLRSAVFAERGKFVMRHLAFDRAPVLTLREGETLLSVGPITETDRSELVTKIVIRYAWRWLKRYDTLGFARSFELDWTTDERLARNKLYLRGDSSATIDKHLHLESRMIQADTDAERAGDKLAELHGGPRKRFKGTVTRDVGHALRIYDVVQVVLSGAPSSDGGGWDGERFVVHGITYGLDTCELQLLEA